MPLTSFTSLPDSARLWVFNSEREFSHSEEEAFRTNLESFLGQWAAHGSPLTVGYEIRHDRFILLGVDDSLVGPSGCSIDAMTDFLRNAGAAMGLDFLDAPDVCFRSGDTIHCVERSEFSRLAEAHSVDASTIVFDKTVSSVGALRQGKWERPAAESWHAKAYDLAHVSS